MRVLLAGLRRRAWDPLVDRWYGLDVWERLAEPDQPLPAAPAERRADRRPALAALVAAASAVAIGAAATSGTGAREGSDAGDGRDQAGAALGRDVRDRPVGTAAPSPEQEVPLTSVQSLLLPPATGTPARRTEAVVELATLRPDSRSRTDAFVLALTEPPPVSRPATRAPLPAPTDTRPSPPEPEDGTVLVAVSPPAEDVALETGDASANAPQPTAAPETDAPQTSEPTDPPPATQEPVGEPQPAPAPEPAPEPEPEPTVAPVEEPPADPTTEPSRSPKPAKGP